MAPVQSSSAPKRSKGGRRSAYRPTPIGAPTLAARASASNQTSPVAVPVAVTAAAATHSAAPTTTSAAYPGGASRLLTTTISSSATSLR